MPYCTPTDLELAAGGAEKLIQIADWNSDGVADADAIAAAQAAADAWIDSFAALRYAVPVAPAGAALVQLAADETIYRLRRRRGPVGQDDVDGHKERETWLKLLSEGKVRPSDPAPAKSSVVASRVVLSTKAVARERLKGYW